MHVENERRKVSVFPLPVKPPIQAAWKIAFNADIMEQDRLHPELFPQALREGCTFHGFLHSKKPALPMRRIKLRTNGEQYQIRPSFMMPCMIGRIEEVEKALYYKVLLHYCS